MGEWRENLMHGTGCYTYADGSKYEGGYLEGKKHGIGTYWTAEGQTFVTEHYLGEVGATQHSTHGMLG